MQTSHLAIGLASDGVTVTSVTDLVTGKKIKDTDKCIVVLDSFITDGGDGYDAGLFQKPIKEFNDLNLEPTVVLLTIYEIWGELFLWEKLRYLRLSLKRHDNSIR